MGGGVGAGKGAAGAMLDAFFPRRCSQASFLLMCRTLALKAASDVMLWPNQVLMAS